MSDDGGSLDLQAWAIVQELTEYYVPPDHPHNCEWCGESIMHDRPHAPNCVARLMERARRLLARRDKEKTNG